MSGALIPLCTDVICICSMTRAAGKVIRCADLNINGRSMGLSRLCCNRHTDTALKKHGIKTFAIRYAKYKISLQY